MNDAEQKLLESVRAGKPEVHRGFVFVQLPDKPAAAENSGSIPVVSVQWIGSGYPPVFHSEN